MLRNGIPEDVTVALRSVSRSFRGWGSHVTVTKPLDDGEALELRRPPPAKSSTAPATAPPTRSSGTRSGEILIAADHLIAHISSNPLITPPARRLRASAPQALVTYIESMREDARDAGRDRPPRPRRADHRPRRPDRRPHRQARAPQGEDLQA